MSRLLAMTLALALLAPAVLLAQGDGGEKYLAFGDSVTFGVGDNSASETGYPTRLQSLLRSGGKEGARVVNHGISGETTTQGLSRINSVLATGGDVILIMEGTNDVNKNISTSTVMFNLEEMVKRSKAAKVTPIWASIIPIRPSALTREDESIAIQMRQKSIGMKIDFVDTYATFDYIPNSWPELYNQSLKNDPVGHPNGKGYDEVAGAFADVILGNDTLAPVLGTVDPVRGSEGVSPNKKVEVVVFDNGSGIDTVATTMIVNGTAVTAKRTGTPAKSTYTYSPPQAWSGRIEVEMDMVDQAGNRERVLATTFIIKGSQFFKGDVNRDGRVDGHDLVFFAFSFGASRNDRRYREVNDLDNNGFVGGVDLAILANNFGKGA